MRYKLGKPTDSVTKLMDLAGSLSSKLKFAYGK